MVRCRGPVRLWFEEGAYADEQIIADYGPSPVYLCDAHHDERVKAYLGKRSEGDFLSLTLAKDQDRAPRMRCADEPQTEFHEKGRGRARGPA